MYVALARPQVMEFLMLHMCRILRVNVGTYCIKYLYIVGHLVRFMAICQSAVFANVNQ